MNTWFVYLVRCSDNSLYCGISTNVRKRITTHNSGKGAKYTKPRLPVKLAYIELVGYLKGDALRREYQIKSLTKSAKEKLCSNV